MFREKVVLFFVFEVGLFGRVVDRSGGEVVYREFGRSTLIVNV